MDPLRRVADTEKKGKQRREVKDDGFLVLVLFLVLVFFFTGRQDVWG